MKEAIGNTFVFNLVIVFVGIISLILVSSISYSRAYKVKNRIINIIEQDRGYVTKNIDTALRDLGYPIRKRNFTCPIKEVEEKKLTNIANSNYKYCVYQGTTGKGNYFIVISYIIFEFPIIGEFISIPVSGETKIFYDIVG